MTDCAICGFKITAYNYTSADGSMHAHCARSQTPPPVIRLMLADRHDAPRRQTRQPQPADVPYTAGQ